MGNFEENLISIYGAQGKAWLAHLPSLVDELASAYGLSRLEPFSNLTFNYVISAYQGKQPVVLKIGMDHKALQREALILEAYAGRLCANVLAKKQGIILIEKAVPGTSLRTFFSKRDHEAIDIASEIMSTLHQVTIPNHVNLPHIKDWLKLLDKEVNIPQSFLVKARLLRDQLLNSLGPLVLLHGDLHHDNILKNQNGWLAIDPKGVIGESAYEVAAFIRNPIPELLLSEDLAAILNHRVDCFSKNINVSRQRIMDWCFVQAVLAWIWALEDNLDGSYWEKITFVFDKF